MLRASNSSDLLTRQNLPQGIRVSSPITTQPAWRNALVGEGQQVQRKTGISSEELEWAKET